MALAFGINENVPDQKNKERQKTDYAQIRLMEKAV